MMEPTEVRALPALPLWPEPLVDVLVTGGTYLDRICMVRDEPQTGLSVEIESETQVLGGPGFCLALAFRRLGSSVALATGLGDCPDSRHAAAFLRTEGVQLLGPAQDGRLDRAEMYVSPSGARIVFNSHIRSQRADYDQWLADMTAQPRIAAIASPTPLAIAQRIADSIVESTSIALLLHTGQLREVANGRVGILRRADLVCIAETDLCMLPAPIPIREGAVSVITRGSRGATVKVGGGASIEIPQPNVLRKRNTNGAGEAFFAALVSDLFSRWLPRTSPPAMSDLCKSIAFAHQYAADHIRAGADLAFPTR